MIKRALLGWCWVLIVLMSAAARANPCSPPLSGVIQNSCTVSEGVLWRGAKPDKDGAADLLTQGVKTVVNLELLHDDRDAFMQARPNAINESVVRYFRIHEWEPNVKFNTSMLDKHVAEFLAIVKTQAKPVYVHCRSGQNRTGVMVAAFRVLMEHQPIESAIDEMGRYQGIWFKQDAQYIRSLVGEHRDRIEKMIEQFSVNLKHDDELICSGQGCKLKK